MLQEESLLSENFVINGFYMLLINIELDEASSVLAALASNETLTRMVYVAAQSYKTDVDDWINSGQAFKTRPEGQLQQSINWLPDGDSSATVFANAAHAPYVEFGTRPHIINAKNRKALKFAGGGGFIFRRSVHHPGSKPFPFFYTDMTNRQENMMNAVRLVLAEAGANG